MKKIIIGLLSATLALGAYAAPVKPEPKPQNLLVEVEQTVEKKSSWLDNISIGFGIGGGWGGWSGGGAGVGVGIPLGGGGDSSGANRTVTTVRIVDGGNAYIESGNGKPLPWVAVQPDGTARRTPSEQSTISGIYVSPALSGDQVIIGIANNQQAVANGVMSNSSLDTTVSGPAGEWLMVGGVVKDTDGQERVLMGQPATGQKLKAQIRVRVSILP